MGTVETDKEELISSDQVWELTHKFDDLIRAAIEPLLPKPCNGTTAEGRLALLALMTSLYYRQFAIQRSMPHSAVMLCADLALTAFKEFERTEEAKEKAAANEVKH